MKRAAPWLTALALISLFITQKCRAIIHFDTNDDPGMIMTASGVLSSVAPSEDLIHTSPLIGLALKHLYLAFPGHPWYALYLYVLTLSYLGLCVYVVVNMTRASAWLCLVILLFLVPFVLHALVTLQFTLVAFNLISVALFLSLEQLDHSTGRWPKLALALLLTFIAGCVRPRLHGVFPVGLLVFAFWLPWFAVGLRKAGQSRWAWISFSILFIAMLFLPRVVSAVYYRNDPGWAAFYEYNSARGKVSDTPLSRIDPRQPKIIEVLKKTGWSANDLLLAESWFVADKETFSYARISRFCQLVPSMLKYNRVSATFARITLGYWQYTSCFALLVCYLSLLRPNLRHIGLQVGNVFYVFSLLMYIGVVAKTEDRIALPAILTGGMISIYIYSHLSGEDGDSNANAWRPILTAAAACAAAFLIVVQLNNLSAVGKRVNAGRARLLGYMNDLTRINPTAYYMSWGGYLHEEYWPPFSREMEGYTGIKIIKIGAITGSPISGRWIGSLGFGEPTDALIRRTDVYVLASEVTMMRLMTFYREHRGIRATYERIGVNNYDVWRVSRSR